MTVHVRGAAAAALAPALLICLLACPALAQDVPDAMPGGSVLPGLLTTFVRSFAYASLFAAAGGALFLVGVIRDDLHLARRLQPGLMALSAAAGVAATVEVGLYGAQAGDGPGALLDLSAWATGLASGRGLGASMLLIALGVLSLGISAHGRPGAAAAGVAGAGAAAVALAVGSEAPAELPGWFGFGIVTLHVLATMVLFGAVWPLVVTLTTQSTGDAFRLVRRFARPSLAAFLTLAASGLALSPAGLVDPDTAFTGYGLVWYGKLLITAAIIAVGLRQGRRLIPDLASGKPGSGTALRRSILGESALYAIAILATVLLQLTQTPFFPLEQP